MINSRAVSTVLVLCLLFLASWLHINTCMSVLCYCLIHHYPLQKTRCCICQIQSSSTLGNYSVSLSHWSHICFCYIFCLFFVCFPALWWHASPSGPKVLFLVIVVLASQNNNSRPQMSLRSSRYWVYTSGQMAGSCAVGAWLEWKSCTLLSHN